MPKGRAKAKRQRNRERIDRAERSRHLPRGVPADAIFCNVTELTNKYIRQGCSLTVSPVMRMVYLIMGVGIGVAAVLGRIFAGTSTLLLILMLVLGFSFVWQSMHLGMDPARQMMKQYTKAGDGSRHHVYFATAKDFGVVLFNGTIRQFPWSMVDTFSGTKDAFALTLKGNPIVFILDSQGFIRGTAEDFVRFSFESIEPEPKSAFYNFSAKTFRTLDNWSVVKAEARAAEIQRKEQRKAEKLARRQARQGQSQG